MNGEDVSNANDLHNILDQCKVGDEVSRDDALLSFSNYFVLVVYAKFFELFWYQVIVRILRGTQLEEILIILEVEPDEAEWKKCFIHVLVMQVCIL